MLSGAEKEKGIMEKTNMTGTDVQIGNIDLVSTESMNSENTVVATTEKTVTGSILFVKEAREALILLEAARTRKEELELAEKKQVKVLTAEKKAVEDQVNSTIKNRQDELSRRYDSEISKVQDAIKKIKTKREKAKQQSMKERISAQLAPYAAENKEMNDKIKALFKQQQVPGFCNTTFYYSLYFPRAMKEVLTMMLTFVICFVAIPGGIFWLLKEPKTWMLILIYLVIVLVFGGIYIVVGNMTKDKHLAALQEAGQIRRQMAKNKKKMKSIKRGIKREKTEEHYDLSSFDAELAVKEQEKAELQAKKEEAMAYFLNTTKPAITEEIVSGTRDKIAQMETEHAQTVAAIQQKSVQVKEDSFRLSRDYESHIGKEFMQKDKLDALLVILESGQAATITDAEALYREQNAKKK